MEKQEIPLTATGAVIRASLEDPQDALSLLGWILEPPQELEGELPAERWTDVARSDMVRATPTVTTRGQREPSLRTRGCDRTDASEPTGIR